MNNIQDRKERSFLKFRDKLDRGKDKVDMIKEKSKINKDISEAQIKKTNILLDMGVLLYEKIRKSEIEDDDFHELCLQIVELDKIIYENNIKIDEIKESKKDAVCDCGNIVNKNNKFCAECGKKTEIEVKIEKIEICSICANEVEQDSNYCVCCGNKIKQI